MNDPEMKALLKEIAKDFNNDEDKALEYMCEQEKGADSPEKVHADTSTDSAIDIDEELKRYDYEEYEGQELESSPRDRDNEESETTIVLDIDEELKRSDYEEFEEFDDEDEDGYSDSEDRLQYPS